MDSERHYHRVVTEISKMIDFGDYPPNTRLPSERVLAKKIGVSRVAIREAEIFLQAQGRLKIKGGSGVYVLSQSEFDLSNFPNVQPLELVQARAHFEAESVALAAPIIKDEALLELENYIAVISGEKKTDMTCIEADAAFYNTIARSTNNQVVMLILDNMWKKWLELPQLKILCQRVYVKDNRYLENEHIAILMALKNKNSDKAREAVQSHFERIIETLLAISEEKALLEVKRKAFENRSRFLYAHK